MESNTKLRSDIPNPEDDGGLSTVAFHLRQGFGGQVAKAEAVHLLHSELSSTLEFSGSPTAYSSEGGSSSSSGDE